MVKSLVAIKDKKVGYFDVRCVDNVDVAKREFSLLFKPGQETSTIYFPDDYELYLLGSYDNANASFDLQNVPVLLSDGATQVKLWKVYKKKNLESE